MAVRSGETIRMVDERSKQPPSVGTTTEVPRGSARPRRVRWLVRVAAFASAATLVGGAVAGLGPTPGVPPLGLPDAPVQAELRGAVTVSEARESAEQAEIPLASLLSAGDLVVGVRADDWNVSVFEFA